MDSCRWLMRGIFKALEPEYYLMFDTGSRPLSMCVPRMTAYMDFRPSCVGVNPERNVDMRGFGKDWGIAETLLKMAQCLEYKANFFIALSESFFGT